jgi:hypothetical protein
VTLVVPHCWWTRFLLSSNASNALVDVAVAEVPPPQPPLRFTPSERLSSELRFVLLACSANPDAGSEAIMDFVSDPAIDTTALDWTRVWQIADHHDVMPLVCAQICALRHVPEPIARKARHEYSRNLQKNIRFTQELLRVLECLEAHGVRALPYKGPVLAQSCYSDLGLRQFSDLDILILPEEIQRAKSALRDLDYGPNFAYSPALEHTYVESGYELAFDAPLGRNLLELQWRLLPKFYSVELPLEQIFARSAFAQLSGNQVRTLGPEDLFITLCLHAAKHGWARLSWVCDLDRAMRVPEIDWVLVRQRADELGILRVVQIGMLIAQEMLGAAPAPCSSKLPLPESVTREIAVKIEALLASCSDCDVESFDYFRLIVRGRERMRDKLRILWRLAFTPGAGEWSTIVLPRSLFLLYRLIRIARLMQRILFWFKARD